MGNSREVNFQALEAAWPESKAGHERYIYARNKRVPVDYDTSGSTLVGPIRKFRL
jgi:hypothetical protein